MLHAAFRQGLTDACVRFGVKHAGLVPPNMTALGARMARPAKRALQLGALGAAGTIGYGLHQQNTEDRAKSNLVYAPLSGGAT